MCHWKCRVCHTWYWLECTRPFWHKQQNETLWIPRCGPCWTELYRARERTLISEHEKRLE
jgi:hypothetical protein